MPDTTTILDAASLAEKHAAGLSWADYLATGKDQQRADWQAVYDRIRLTDAQRKLLGSFTRQINAICLSGIWCGDCVQQGPLIQRIAEACPALDLRWLDRDEHPDLAQAVAINAGQRVPVLILAAEDHELVSWFGDRTLTRYRALAQKRLGGACPLPGAPVPQGELEATLQEWLDEIERVHLLLRLSTRLRKQHQD